MTTPEEDFNQEVWYVLGKIESERLATTEGKPVEYGFPEKQVLSPGLITQDREKKVLYKLQEWGALRIRENPWEPPESTPHLFYLDLIQPKYEQTYIRFQKACDLDAYLNDYQNKIYKNKKPPEFQKVDTSKLALRPGLFFGYTEPTAKTSDARKIADGFSEQNRPFVKSVLEDILSLLDFSSDDKVSYQIKSPPGQEIIKERSLLSKFESFGLFRNLGEDGLFGIATLSQLDIPLIKEIIRRIEELDSGVISEEELQETIHDKDSEPEKKVDSSVAKKKDVPLWSNDFHWEGKKFIFGEYGSTSNFSSDDRLALFKEFTKAKGFWVLMTSLIKATKTKKDAVYIRQTIGQIEGSFSKELRRYISISSTRDDDLEPKPQNSAYRIKFTPKSP